MEGRDIHPAEATAAWSHFPVSCSRCGGVAGDGGAVMVGRIQLLMTVLSVTTMAIGGGMLSATGPTLDNPDAPVDVVEQVDSPTDNGSVPNGSTNESANTTEPEVESGVDSVDRSRRSNVRVDDVVILVDYVWDADAEVFRLTFESDRPRQITVTERVQSPEGAGTFDIQTERLEDGLTEVAIQAEPAGGEVAVSITTSASVRQGNGVYVSTGISDQQGPWSTTGSAAGWFGGLSVGLSMMVAAAWQAKRRDYDAPEDYQ